MTPGWRPTDSRAVIDLGDEQLVLTARYLTIEQRLAPDDVTDLNVTERVDGDWHMPGAPLAEHRWFWERWDEATDAWYMLGEPYWICGHTQASDITCWYPRFPQAVLCGGCSLKLDLAIMSDESACCDSCGESSPVLGILAMAGLSMLGKAVLCHVCSPALRELADGLR
jgi:hypothetical protein